LAWIRLVLFAVDIARRAFCQRQRSNSTYLVALISINYQGRFISFFVGLIHRRALTMPLSVGNSVLVATMSLIAAPFAIYSVFLGISTVPYFQRQ
jgi:hypothetical protein